ALAELLARRRGTHPDRRARTADELALLLDRAGDLTLSELRDRVSESEGARAAGGGSPVDDLIGSGRAVPVRIPDSPTMDTRYVLVESLPRYLSAFDGIDVPGSVPQPFRQAS